MEETPRTDISVSNDLFDLQEEFFDLGGKFLGNCLALRHCLDKGDENYLQSLVSDYLDCCEKYLDLSDRFAYLISLQQDLLKEDLQKAGAYGVAVGSD